MGYDGSDNKNEEINQKKEKENYAMVSEDERKFLLDLEKTLNLPYISTLNVLKEDAVGYIAKDGHIIGLGIKRAGLKHIPPSIQNLEHLRILDLRNNKISGLPSNFKSLGSLEILHLQGNDFSYFPQEMRSLSRLKYLDFSHNKLREVPDFVSSY